MTKNMRNAIEFNHCPANLLGSRLVDIGPEVLEDGKQEVEGALLSPFCPRLPGSPLQPLGPVSPGAPGGPTAPSLQAQ